MDNRNNAFNYPIRIHYQPPKALVYFMTLSHAGALLCLFPVALPLWLKVLLTGVVITNFIRFLCGFSRDKATKPGLQLFLNRDDEWWLLDADNEALALSLKPGSLVHRWLLVLRFVAEDGKSSVFILSPENVEHNTLRRLRVRLLHGKARSEPNYSVDFVRQAIQSFLKGVRDRG